MRGESDNIRARTSNKAEAAPSMEAAGSAAIVHNGDTSKVCERIGHTPTFTFLAINSQTFEKVRSGLERPPHFVKVHHLLQRKNGRYSPDHRPAVSGEEPPKRRQLQQNNRPGGERFRQRHNDILPWRGYRRPVERVPGFFAEAQQHPLPCPWPARPGHRAPRRRSNPLQVGGTTRSFLQAEHAPPYNPANNRRESPNGSTPRLLP